MDADLKQNIQFVLKTGKDLTLATLRADGWPQATTVSYASDGEAVYFGCGEDSQKAANLARDDRVSLTVTLPYVGWEQIRGLSMAGRARRLTAPEDILRVGKLFLDKFSPELEKHFSAEQTNPALFEVRPEVVSLLDYRKGFGHTDLVAGAALV